MANISRRVQPESSTPAFWEPFRLMRDMMNWDPFAEMLPSWNDRRPAVFSPQFEVKETRDAYVFRADLPGVQESDIDISLTGNRLTVSGKREAERRQEDETYYAYERSYGTFSRSFTLPDGIAADNVEAELHNGVLTVSVPKRPEHQPRRISLKGVASKVKGALGGKDKANA
jgi:HSP20 family protein